jgi:hypothetical protein
MILRLAMVAALIVGACGCASHRTASEVDAVVNDEAARQAARNVAATTGDSKQALEAAADASTGQTTTPK